MLNRENNMKKLQRISFTQTEVGMMNEIVDHQIQQAEDISHTTYVHLAIVTAMKAKSEMLKKLLGEGVIE